MLLSIESLPRYVWRQGHIGTYFRVTTLQTDKCYYE